MIDGVYSTASLRTNGKKLDMILIQAFPANRTLSTGIIKYLSNYFNVHFIDLPGFYPGLVASSDCRPETFVKFVEKKINELNLERYILAGISFGFLIANSVETDRQKCIAILGSGPYLGVDYVQLSWIRRLGYLSLLLLIDQFHLENLFWGKTLFKKILARLLDEKSDTIIEVIVSQVVPQTFFRTAIQILKYRQEPVFKDDMPYILLINPNDSAIKFDKTLRTMWHGVQADLLRVILTKTPHYPPDPSYEFFVQSFTQNEIESLFNFVDYAIERQAGSAHYRA